MTDEQFQEIVDQLIDRVRQTLHAKGKEYARDDRLSNFKKSAHLQGITPEQALAGMLAKHIVSIYDLVADLNRDERIPMVRWHEKITDAISYLILLEACLYERLWRRRIDDF